MSCGIGTADHSTFSKEGHMPFVTGDVVPSPGGETPFKVVFKKGDTVIVEWPVESKEAGEEEIVEVLESIADDD
jgi:hypothetical protein